MTQRCGAERPPVKPFGWECTGYGLVVVMRGPAGVPVVVPKVLLGVIGEGARQVMDKDPQGGQPFGGGDHMHLLLPLEQSVRDAIQETGLHLR